MKKKITDLDKKVIIFNKKFCDMLDLRKNEFIEVVMRMQVDCMKLQAECKELQSQLLEKGQENVELDMLAGKLEELLQIFEKERPKDENYKCVQ